jgi:hypothetical protein
MNQMSIGSEHKHFRCHPIRKLLAAIAIALLGISGRQLCILPAAKSYDFLRFTAGRGFVAKGQRGDLQRDRRD